MLAFKNNLSALLSNNDDNVETAIASYRDTNNLRHVNINEGEYSFHGDSSAAESQRSGESLDAEGLDILLLRDREEK